MTEVIGVVSGGWVAAVLRGNRGKFQNTVGRNSTADDIGVDSKVGDCRGRKNLVERWKSFPGCPQWPRWCRWSKLQKTNDDTLINLILILMISPTFNEVNCIDYFTRTLSIAFMTCYHAHKSHYTLYFT